MTSARQVEIYTDGSCLGNPGPGGYGVVMLYGENRRELSGGFRLTTNNRMEMLAVSRKPPSTEKGKRPPPSNASNANNALFLLDFSRWHV